MDYDEDAYEETLTPDKRRRMAYPSDDMIRYSVVSSIVPFTIVTIIHISYALSHPVQYNSNSKSVLLIILNVLCIIPYLSWLIFVVMIVWFIVLFTSADTHNVISRQQRYDLYGGGLGLQTPQTSLSDISTLLSSSQSTLESYSGSGTIPTGSSQIDVTHSSKNFSFSEISQSMSEFDA